MNKHDPSCQTLETILSPIAGWGKVEVYYYVEWSNKTKQKAALVTQAFQSILLYKSISICMKFIHQKEKYVFNFLLLYVFIVIMTHPLGFSRYTPITSTVLHCLWGTFFYH